MYLVLWPVGPDRLALMTHYTAHKVGVRVKGPDTIDFRTFGFGFGFRPKVKLPLSVDLYSQEDLQDSHKPCIVHVHYYAVTCNLQPITAYRPIDVISRLLTERGPDWQAWSDVAPPISLQLVTFIAAVIGFLAAASESSLRESSVHRAGA